MLEKLLVLDFTKKQKEKYLKARKWKCPKCHSDNISGGEIEFVDKKVTQEAVCNDCGCAWQDIYTLSEVTRVE